MTKSYNLANKDSDTGNDVDDTAPEYRIIVRLPSDRDFAGALDVQDPEGNIIAGPFWVCARADDRLARANGNPSRDPQLPYGDTPTGGYRYLGTLKSGSGTRYRSVVYGSSGVIVLEPVDGNAALADANGRFRLLIHGGPTAPGGKLVPADGSLRLSNSDQRQLVRAVRGKKNVTCLCITDDSDELKTERVDIGLGAFQIPQSENESGNPMFGTDFDDDDYTSDPWPMGFADSDSGYATPTFSSEGSERRHGTSTSSSSGGSDYSPESHEVESR